MSAPLAGKFQDHYAILGIDPNSDLETRAAISAPKKKIWRPGAISKTVVDKSEQARAIDRFAWGPSMIFPLTPPPSPGVDRSEMAPLTILIFKPTLALVKPASGVALATETDNRLSIGVVQATPAGSVFNGNAAPLGT